MRNVFMSLLLAILLTSHAYADDKHLIIVTGSAEKSFKPDMAIVSLSLWGKGSSAKGAQEINQKYSKLLKKSLSKFNIKDADVQTSEYSLNPDYVYNQEAKKNILTGYQVTEGLNVIIRNVEDVGAFIDSLSDDKKVVDGRINLNSLSFDLSTRKLEEQNLLTEAVKSAEEKATILAKAANVKIKGIHRLAPIQSGERPIHMRANLMMEKSAGTQLMSGQVRITSEVSAEFMIK